MDTVTVTLTRERFEAVRWAINVGINLRNMAIQEALIEASNDFDRAALAATGDNPKHCGGSGRVYPLGAAPDYPCPGCSHPECPNREADRG